MTNENVEALLRLQGTQTEQDWLREHLETLSVQEGTILSAVLKDHPPNDMAEVINHMLTLNEYEVRYGAGNRDQLAEFCMRANCVPKDLREYIDTTALGDSYMDEHPGMFMDGCYVEYPQKELSPQYNGQGVPPEMPDWCVRLKLASELVPGGLWVKLPDYNDMNDEPGNLRMTEDALRARTINDCTLLEARCILPEIRNLAGQYNNLADLIYDAQDLGCLLDEQGQGMPGFWTRFAAAMEYEDCRHLSTAVEIAKNLRDYDYIPAAKLHDYAVDELQMRGALESVQKISEHFDYDQYAADLLAKEGFIQVMDGEGYVVHSKPPEQTQAPGMTM